MEKRTVLTREDHKRLVDELDYLKTVGRDDIAEKIKVARSFGDLSENAEYDEAMNEQAKLEANIAKLEASLRNATILDEEEIHDNATVRIGSKVLLFDYDENEEVEYKILGKSDPANHVISDQSPVGAALIGASVGDVVDVVLPSEEVIQFKVLAISR